MPNQFHQVQDLVPVDQVKNLFHGRWQLSSIAPCIQCYNRNSQTRMNDFSIISTIGNGSFGKVILVKENLTGAYFAMKVMSKAFVSKVKQVKHVIDERRILDSINFPFLVQLVEHFQTKKSLCLVMEVVRGGELFVHLRSRGKFQENEAKFYLQEIIVSIEYLHSLGIVYRDLKPENILLDERGHVKITDFGFATKMTQHRPTKTYCGTPEYLAPEIICGIGYDHSVDWWALGILTFEMCSGTPPFTSDIANDTDSRHKEILGKIMKNKIIYPKHFSNELVDFIRRLLCKNAKARLGFIKNSIKEHVLFSETDWDKVLDRQLSPPISPTDLLNTWIDRIEDNYVAFEEVVENELFEDF